MTKTKWKALLIYKPQIEEVVIDKENETHVWINGFKERKRGAIANYYDTFDQAYEASLAHCNAALKRSTRSLQNAEHDLSRFLEEYSSHAVG